MPLSRPMPSIGKGVHELRFRDRTGVFRVIYVFVGSGDIWLLHGFVKRTQLTPKPNIDVAKKEIKGDFMKRKSSAEEIAKVAGVSPERSAEAIMKAQLITAISSAIEESHITHQEIALKTGIPRSAVTGILSGSLQKVTLDRVIKILGAVGLRAELKVRKTA